MRIESAVDNGIAESTAAATATGLRTSFRETHDPQLAQQLTASLKRLEVRMDSASASLEQAVHGTNSDTSSTATAASTAADVSAQLPAELDRLLAARIDAFRAASRRVHIMLGLGLAIAMYAFASLYLLATRSLRERLDVSEARYGNLVDNLPTITYAKTQASAHAAIEVSFMSCQALTMLEIAPDRFLGDPELCWEQCTPTTVRG